VASLTVLMFGSDGKTPAPSLFNEARMLPTVPHVLTHRAESAPRTPQALPVASCADLPKVRVLIFSTRRLYVCHWLP
jgi:hypothetical protein